jgi:hypothetical protein
VGTLQQERFLTKFLKPFGREELADDLFLVPAQWGQVRDSSEYEELLPGSAP